MITRRRWMIVDWLKLIVAVILAALVIAALLSQRQPGGAPPGDTQGGEQGQSISLQPVFNAGESPTATATGQTISLQPVFDGGSGTAPTATGEGQSVSLQPVFNDSVAGDPSAQEPTATSTLEPTATPTDTPSPEPTSSTPQTPTATATLAPTFTPTVTPMGAVANQVDCYRASLPARLSMGQKAKVRVALNIRENPGVTEGITGYGQPGDVVDITGGPVCTAHGNGVFRWWALKKADGSTGWAAEGADMGTVYYLEPAQ